MTDQQASGTTFVSVVPPEGTVWTNIPPEGIHVGAPGSHRIVLGVAADPALQTEIRYEVHEDGSVTTDIPGCCAVISDGYITGFSFSSEWKEDTACPPSA